METPKYIAPLLGKNGFEGAATIAFKIYPRPRGLAEMIADNLADGDRMKDDVEAERVALGIEKGEHFRWQTEDEARKTLAGWKRIRGPGKKRAEKVAALLGVSISRGKKWRFDPWTGKPRR